jgi:methyltransferase (TIGR00027 family)
MTSDVVPSPAELRGVADTARWTAAARARESTRDDRLFTDPYAELLAGPTGPATLRHFHPRHAADEGNPVLPTRTRWFDDFLRDAVRTPGQIVGLGAGLDTRAYRLGWPAGTVLYELDQPELLRYKADRLSTTPAVTRCDRRPVAVDFTGPWEQALLAAGFDPARPTVWFAEGLLFYLTREVAGATLRSAAELSAPGSRLAADLIGTGVFRLRYMAEFLDRLRAAGSPWVFGTDTPREFLSDHGWPAVEVTEPGDPAAHYGRWPDSGALRCPAPNLPRTFFVAATM